jgi:site-specific recombinase XerD
VCEVLLPVELQNSPEVAPMTLAPDPNAPDLAALLPSWQRALAGANRSRATRELYVSGVSRFLAWCGDTGTSPELTRSAVNAFVGDLLANGAADATAVARQKSLRQFSKWLHSEGEIEADQLAGLQRPHQGTKVTRALDDEHLAALVRACQGRSLLDRRDEAVVRLMAETALRAGELLALTIADVDLDRGVALIRKGKGNRQRQVPFGAATVASLDRYLRARRGIPTPLLWVGVYGTPLGYHGLSTAIKGRAKAAGINNFHLHLLRHTAATRWLRAGGNEQALMTIAGWSSRSMMDRYTAASAGERATEEARRLRLGEF